MCIQMFINEMETIEPSLKEMKEVEAALRAQPIASINTWTKSRLVDCQSQWEKLSKQVSSPRVASACLLLQLSACVALGGWCGGEAVKQWDENVLLVLLSKWLKSNLNTHISWYLTVRSKINSLIVCN